ncbi:MAG: response regulator [Burkholderiaceae bacterium]|nr:response regulator [Burkholderiaceae bacterium]
MPLNTILVEDNKTIQDTLVPALAELGDSRVVAIAATAADAKRALLQWQGRWHLIVVDLFLRKGSGIEVLQAMNEGAQPRGQNQHVYVLTNYATSDMRQRCAELGADGVYDKSTELEAFFEMCSGLRR